jgi:hypothetical protein
MNLLKKFPQDTPSYVRFVLKAIFKLEMFLLVKMSPILGLDFACLAALATLGSMTRKAVVGLLNI